MDDNEAAPAAAVEEAVPVESAEPAAPVETTEDQPYTEEQQDADLQAIWDKNNKPRDETGKFVSSKPATDEPEQVSDQKPIDAKGEQPKAAIAVPQSWSADVKAKWETLPSDVQEYISKREQQSHEAISRQGQQINALRPIQEAVERNASVFQAKGVDPGTGVTQLIEASNYLDRDPYAAIEWLMNVYRVDPRRYVERMDPNAPPLQEDAELRREVVELRAALNETRNRVENRERVETETQFKTLNSKVADFAKDKPDWEDLEPVVLKQLRALRTSIDEGESEPISPDEMLKIAWKNARLIDDKARAKDQETERKAEEKRKLEEAQKRAKDARKSQPINVKTSPANATTGRTMDEDLQEIARRAYGT